MDPAANTSVYHTPDQQMRLAANSPAQKLLRYSFAILLVGAAVAICEPLRSEIYITPFMLAAVVISAWYGGVGPGIAAVVASVIALYYFFQLQHPQPRPLVSEIPRLVQFAAIGLVINYLIEARKRAEKSLREARDGLEVKVIARTADLQEANEKLQQEVTDRRRAEEIARTTAQLARSHVEVIMRSLDVLATESAPDQFIGEMLKTIGQHLNARNLTIWLRTDPEDRLCLRLAIEDEQQVVQDWNHPFVKDPLLWKSVPVLQEMLFTGAPVVCEDAEHDPRLGDIYRHYLVKRGTKRFFIIPMFVKGEVHGFIGIQHMERGTYRTEEIEFAQALTHQVMLALELTHLADQERQAAILKERTRMARDIHDTLAQGFTGVIVQMEAAEEALLDEEPEHVVQHVRRAKELARESLGEARRSVHALRPQALEKAAFAQALKTMIQNTTAGTPLYTSFRLEGEPHPLAPSVEDNLLQVGREALTNALKHAKATEFHARITFDTRAVRLELEDNGVGFDLNERNGAGFGLIGMKERAEHIGGTLTLTSKHSVGTKVVVLSPYQPHYQHPRKNEI